MNNEWKNKCWLEGNGTNKLTYLFGLLSPIKEGAGLYTVQLQKKSGTNKQMRQTIAMHNSLGTYLGAWPGLCVVVLCLSTPSGGLCSKRHKLVVEWRPISKERKRKKERMGEVAREEREWVSWLLSCEIERKGMVLVVVASAHKHHIAVFFWGLVTEVFFVVSVVFLLFSVVSGFW